MPTAETLFLLVLSILVVESAVSIRSLYRHFLAGATKKSLNAFYYACSYTKADYSKFMNTTAGMALELIPENYSHSLCFCALITQWPRNLAKNSRMFQSFLTIPRIIAQTI